MQDKNNESFMEHTYDQLDFSEWWKAITFVLCSDVSFWYQISDKA